MSNASMASAMIVTGSKDELGPEALEASLSTTACL
jgi:hypothetical protein